jgi:putative flippase GtrA
MASMTTTADAPTGARSPAGPGPLAPVVDVVIPVYNEARQLEQSVRTVRAYLDERFPFTARVTIADNASHDGTWEIAARLAAQIPGVRAVRLEQKGRGRALKAAWNASDAAVLAYMDVDLATDLDAFLPLVAPLVSGHSDIAIGSRLAPGAHVLRGAKREVISRSYNLVLRAMLRARFSDAQCGFKAVRADVARSLLPLVDDDGWFFDTELLALAEHNGMRIHEVPVDWVDDPDSRVDIVHTALADLRGTWRLWRQFAAGRGTVGTGRRAPELASTAVFAGVGGLSTIAYVVAFLCLQPTIGSLAANAVAWTVASLGNAGLHRLAGSEQGESVRARAALWAAGLALSTVVLATTAALTTSLPVAVVVLLASGAVVSTVRFVTLRQSQYRGHLESGRTRPGHGETPR